MVYDIARMLAQELQNSEEYRRYHALKEAAMENDTTKTLIAEYHRLQFPPQAAAMQGKKDDALLEKLQKIGEVLQFDKNASAYLIAEYQMNRMLSDVYKILAEAIDVDLSALEA